MKFSVFAFLSAALSTSSSILAAVDSPNSFSVLIFKTPSRLIQPLIAELPAYTLRGTDSPVRAEVSRTASPSITIPSRGIFSPVLTVIMLPG